MNKIEHFFETVRLLSGRFGIVPLLYGSLGLEYLTGNELGASDIDILVPRVFIAERWREFRSFLEENGYVLNDEHEHTFVREGVAHSFADIEDLEVFAGICAKDIGVHESDGARFLLLSLEQYLTVYRRSSKDGYRVNIRQKKDAEKIRFIESIITDKE